MNQDALKKAVAEAALAHVEPGEILGVGTGSTANFFIRGKSNTNFSMLDFRMLNHVFHGRYNFSDPGFIIST